MFLLVLGVATTLSLVSRFQPIIGQQICSGPPVLVVSIIFFLKIKIKLLINLSQKHPMECCKVPHLIDESILNSCQAEFGNYGIKRPEPGQSFRGCVNICGWFD